MTRLLRVALFVASATATTAAHAQVCTRNDRERHRTRGLDALHARGPRTVIQGFAVSPLVVAYSYRRIGDQPEVRVVVYNALALDASALFVAEDDPFVIKQVVPR